MNINFFTGISKTGLETQENFTKFIFKEFTYFYEIFNIMNAFLLDLGGNFKKIKGNQREREFFFLCNCYI